MKQSRAEYWLAEFMEQVAELDWQVERFNTLRDAHFGYDSQALNAGHIGQIKRAILHVQALNALFEDE